MVILKERGGGHIEGERGVVILRGKGEVVILKGPQYTVYNVWCTVHCIQCVVYNTLYTMCGVQYTVYNVWCTGVHSQCAWVCVGACVWVCGWVYVHSWFKNYNIFKIKL